jgi:hypothetical protein
MHPVDALAAFAPKEIGLRETLSEMLLDFTGGGIASSAAAVSAIRELPSQRQMEEMQAVAESLLECAALGGAMADGLVHATFVVAMEDFCGKSISDATEGQRAVAQAVSSAVFGLVSSGRQDEALGAALIGCVLYCNAEAWHESR